MAVPSRRLLIAHDFSPCGDAAFEAGIRLARDLKAEVVLVHAFAGRFLAPGAEYAVAGLPADRETVLEEDDAIELTTTWAEKARASGLKVTTVAREGAPADVVLEEATKHDVALVVIGSHGRRGVRRLILGSTAEAITRRADRPVLVVPVPHAK